jgi:hypothetical protein
MAVIRGQRQNVNPNNLVPNVLPNIILTDENLNDAMYLTLFNLFPKKTPEPQYELKWNVDGFLPENDTTSAAVTATSGTVSVTNPNYYIVNDTWYNKRTGEMFKVTAVDTSNSQITVIRGLGAKDNGTGTSASAMNSGDLLIRLATSVNPEKSRSQTARSTDLNEVVNYTQAMRWEIEMGRRQVKAAYFTGADMKYQMEKVFKEARKDISRALLFNEKSKYTDENNNIITTTQGIFNVPTTNQFNVGGTLYENSFDQFLVDEALRYGSSNKWLVCSTDIILAINEMAKDRVEIKQYEIQKGKELGFEVMKYTAPNGRTLNIVEDRSISNNRNGDGVIVDMDMITYCHHSGNGINDDFHLVTNDATENDATNSQAYLYGDIGMKWGDELCHAVITNVTGGASGRAVS